MENLSKWIKKTENKNSDDKKEKNRDASSQKIIKKSKMVYILVLISILPILLMAFIAGMLRDVEPDSKQVQNEFPQYNLETKFWNLNQITKSEANVDEFNIELLSSAGNFRRYQNIKSFGLSNNKQYIALLSLKGIEIVKLEDESIVLAETNNQKIAGTLEESISWNSENNMFALSVYLNDYTNNTAVLVYNIDGSLSKEFKVSLPVKIEKINDKDLNIVERVAFSKVGNLLLSRTFKSDDLEVLKEDGSTYKIDELPIYLSIFDTEGNLTREFNVRDYDTSGNRLIYRWNKEGKRFVEYIIYSEGLDVNPTQDFLFTKLGF